MIGETSEHGGGSAVLDPSAVDAEVALNQLAELLDLSNVRMKLQDSEEGPGLGASEIDLMEGEYRKFLALQIAHPNADIVPCKIVDEMWHRHILDTAATARTARRFLASSSITFPTSGCVARMTRRPF